MKFRLALILFAIVTTLVCAHDAQQLGKDYLDFFLIGYVNAFALVGAVHLRR